MKGFNYSILLMIIALLVAGCASGSKEGAESTITMEHLANMEYQSEFTKSGTAPLENGEYSEEAAPGSDGELVDIANMNLGDRVQINSLAIEDGKIVVDIVTHGADDPMCCPTQEVVKRYELQDELVEVPS